MARRPGIPAFVMSAALAMPLAGCSGSSGPSTDPAVSHAPAPASEAVAGSAGTAAGAGADAAIEQQITNVAGGDPEAFRDLFDRLQKAIAAGDQASVAALVSYPLEVDAGDKRLELASAQDLIAHWDAVVTPEVTDAIVNQKFSDAFVNQNGLMIGDGQVWLGAVCDDDTCKTSKTAITAIQQGPKQQQDHGRRGPEP